MFEVQKPYCLAMVLCDAVHRDSGSGKFTLRGTFQRVIAKAQPISVQFCVYFALTDGLGEMRIGIRVVDSRDLLSDDRNGSPLARMERRIGFPHPFATIEGALALQIAFPRPDLYHCELYSGDEVLMSRRIAVVRPQAEKNDKLGQEHIDGT